eukprot:CAMPEP_0117653098 /NCGR_PEP_ID=MMETSP0804-20121206/3004_1 /TAXON_ID=1074897 /ORGANISM="Tetraselmis astigmatica, Strain CCMP880" /LENGTH=580 /DNA_ID=CAMNT_0005459239 /DNA_START=84 /DNA_END=1826 /DNA_ORIENTATION=+
MDAAPPKKRSRGLGAAKAKAGLDKCASAAVDPSPALPTSSPVNPDLLQPGAIDAKRQEYQSSQPYPNLVLHKLGDEQQMRAVRDEIITHLRATFKETDLFKVLQTGDLKNMDELDPEQLAKLPQLQALRDGLYSPEFRGAVEAMTGCGPLNDRTDMAANVYSQGHHLLCHDDVIGTRRISYIIYLTDPDDAWEEKDGGGLELFPVLEDAEGVPDTTPTKVILPEWNSLAMFTVVPGQSFHAVQEVFASDKPRLTIQGWFHADEEPKHKDMASLSQLKSMAKGKPAELLPVKAGRESPTPEDVEFLSQWINATYLKPETWAQVAATFRQENSVQLQGFLKPDISERIVSGIQTADASDHLGRGMVPRYDAGVGAAAGCSCWEVVGPPHMQRFLRYKAAAADTVAPGDDGEGGVGKILHDIQGKLFGSAACARLLGALADLEPKAVRSEVRRFRPGLDYTVAHYGVLTQDDRLDATLCFVADQADEDDASWAVGEVGGYECYIAAEDDETGGDVAVYKADEEDDGGLINVAARANTLNLVHRDQGIMHFVKYVSHLAPSSRLDVAVEYQVDIHEEEDEGGES